jgi:hypothetical protein
LISDNVPVNEKKDWLNSDEEYTRLYILWRKNELNLIKPLSKDDACMILNFNIKYYYNKIYHELKIEDKIKLDLMYEFMDKSAKRVMDSFDSASSGETMIKPKIIKDIYKKMLKQYGVKNED